MSAFLVTREHINYLLQSALSHRIQRQNNGFRWSHDGISHELHEAAEASEIGQMLWDENQRSVNARYSQKNEAPVFEYKHVTTLDLYAVQLFKACDCYEYQSCETGDKWYSSEACAFINALRRHAWQTMPGYSDAAWEITELRPAHALKSR